jgi:hypothetical protein
MISWDFKKGHMNRIKDALSNILRKANIEKQDFPYFCAVGFKDLLLKNLLSQKFSATYQPYSEKYADWKTKKMLMGSTFWRLYGDLLASIEIVKDGSGWFAGIPKGVMDSGGKSMGGSRSNRIGRPKYIGMYATIMERGNLKGTQPARPAFDPSTEEYAAKEWITEGDKALRRFKALWK